MKKLLIGEEAREALKSGIEDVYKAVSVSLGKNGRNVAIYNGTKTEIINDGVSIAKAVVLKDENKMAGVQLAKQCAEKTDLDAGDGTTTTIVLLHAFTQELIKPFQTHSRQLREELKKATEKLFSFIQPKKLETQEDMYNLALTSSLNEQAATTLSEAFFTLGKNAKVALEEGEGETTSEVVSGLQFSSRLASESILSSLVEEKKVLEDVPVLVFDRVETGEEIGKFLEKNAVQDVVVIANQFERKVLLSMMGSNVNFYPIENKEINGFEDIKEYSKKPLKVVITREHTTLIGGEVSPEYVDVVKKSGETAYEKELVENRLARLTSGVLSIKVGGDTPVERNELYLKYEDASNALKFALQDGFVKGAGLALKDASEHLSDEGAEGVVKRVAQVPYSLISSNVEVVPDSVIDSYKTVRSSFHNALSTATSILMVEAALIEEPEEL